MNSSFFLGSVVAAIGFFSVFRKFRVKQDNKEQTNSTSPPPSSVSPSYSSQSWTHQVFPSFHGEDVRVDFLSHIQKEFRRKGIIPFIDNEIRRGESIGPELINAIRESKIAVVLFSRNYASSKWCLDELVEIMKCREEFGQTVIPIFYKVDPSNVKKLTGDFGSVFRNTCEGKTKEVIGRWRQALAKLATIAGYDSRNWYNEAAMIEKIVIDILNMLNNSTPSSDFDSFVGMQAHMENMESKLGLGSDEVRMVGIWGPPGIGVAQYMLQNKKVIVVLDNVDRSIYLDAIAKEIRWFGPGSRIIITTQDKKLLKAYGINHIYKVDYPSPYEACQIFCMYAFDQKFPKVDFEELAWEVTLLLGQLPLGLRVMGSYFRGMSKQEWKNALPSEDERIEMHNLLVQLGREIVRCELGKRSIREPGQRQFLVDAKDVCDVLTDDTAGSRNVLGINLNLSDIEDKLNVCERAFKRMSNLKFLRFHYAYGDQSDKLYLPQGLKYLSRKLRLLEWERYPLTCLPSNFHTEYLVKLKMRYNKLHKLWESNRPLRNLKWIDFSYSKDLKKLPDLSTANNLREVVLTECSSLVELLFSIENVINLQRLILFGCSSLVMLPSSIERATNLLHLSLVGCSSLVELPNSLGNFSNLKNLYLDRCTGLVELPYSIGNATNLQLLSLDMCTGLVELPSSIGNLHKLLYLTLKGCLKLEILPININLESLEKLDLTDCSRLKLFPEISTNIKYLELKGTAVKEVPLSIKSWSRLDCLEMSYSENLKNYPHALDIITTLYLDDTKLQEIHPWVKRSNRLWGLMLDKCKKLVSLSHIPDSLSYLDASNCESLEILDCSFHNPEIYLDFTNCLKLNKEARELIIQTESKRAFLPGREVPAYFTYRATNGSSMTVKSNQWSLSTTGRFKACVLLVDKGVVRAGDGKKMEIYHHVTYRKNGLTLYEEAANKYLPVLLTEHLYIIEVETEAAFTEIVFKFGIESDKWGIGEGGVLQLPDKDKH
ncbi:Toll/interleukin-1 receptor homology (TIR) domain [Arabidopsis suecica]|uniref:Toll/interleukin-1 receptor homology (TIR) domain n=1 Tax=Arabidopsis suecica TaxID=45249 RepID=A0A8T1ZXY8_ARASU|nr:Toll/interleukin-1 receptor homology (TIR) domain [Arabidopsis suecica]